MVKYIIGVLIFIFGSLAAIYFFVGVPKVYNEEQRLESSAPHVYENPERSIEEIKIVAAYFVPRNKSEEKNDNWQIVLQRTLLKLQEFHVLQFQGKSRVAFEIYPEPIIGLKDSIEYDTEITQGGNPRALLKVAEELEDRVFGADGDLFRKNFGKFGGNVYPVLAIMYEGVGASGGVIYESELEAESDIAREVNVPESLIYIVDVTSVDGFFLLNRVFLDDPEYREKGESIFTHEFYHTLGVPDAYEVPGVYETPVSQDIMGAGRFRPIEKTYLDKNTLHKFGL